MQWSSVLDFLSVFTSVTAFMALYVEVVLKDRKNSKFLMFAGFISLAFTCVLEIYYHLLYIK